MNSVRLSLAIITFNEEKNILRCIKSARMVADEVLVIDSFSADATCSLAASAGAKVIMNHFHGHIQQKNFAITQCTYDWILSLDADEALDETLLNSILEVKRNPQFFGYRMNRLNNYCGQWIRHCGWYPDTKIRLFHKSYAHWTGINPHDRLELNEGISSGFLDGDILHYSYPTRADHLLQIENFSSIAAKEFHKKGVHSGWLILVVKVIAQFFKSYFLKTGFLDGRAGFTISRLSAFATYRKYYKLMQINKGYEI